MSTPAYKTLFGVPDTDRVRLALTYLDPNTDRTEWFKVLCSLKEGLGNEGYQLALDWSRQSPRFNKASFEDTWKSIRASGGRTIYSLLGKATDLGMPLPEHTNQALKDARFAEAERQRKEAQDTKSEQDKAFFRELARKVTPILWAKRKPVTDCRYLAGIENIPDTLGMLDMPAIIQTLDEVYSRKKLRGKPPNGLSATDNCLVVPIKNTLTGKPLIAGVQVIDQAGNKNLITGSRMSGSFWATRRLPDDDGTGSTIIIGEGIRSVLACTDGTQAYGVAVLTNNNYTMGKTFGWFMCRYPSAKIIIAQDFNKNGKPDPISAEAAERHSVTIIRPDFGDSGDQKQSDFYDLLQSAGRAEVNAQISAAV